MGAPADRFYEEANFIQRINRDKKYFIKREEVLVKGIMTKEVRKRIFAIYVAINCSDLSRGAGAVLTDRGTAGLK